MREEDFGEFTAMLDGVCQLLTRGGYVPSPTNSAMFFRALARYSLADVRRAMDLHVSDPVRGRFAPVPADLIAQIEAAAAKSDGRPGPEEAWAMIPLDESGSVVWTDEMARAFGAAIGLLQDGDRVAARMAFKEAYARECEAARRAGTPANWSPSLGHDPRGHTEALRAAVEAGRVSIGFARSIVPELPAPSPEVLARIAGATGRIAIEGTGVKL